MSLTLKRAVRAVGFTGPAGGDALANLADQLRSLPRAAWILFFGTFLNKFGTFVIPFLALYMTRQGYSMADAGLAISAYGVGNLIAAVLGGHLADTLGRRKTIVLSMASGAAAMMLLSQARGLPALVVLTGVTGLAAELYRPASSALLADLVPAAQRVTAYSAYRMAFNAGWAFGPATAGFLAARSFFWLFVGDAGTSLLFGAVAYFALPKTTPRPGGERAWADALTVLRRDRRLHRVLLAAFGVALVFYQMSSSYGLRVTGLGFSTTGYGALISLNGLMVVLCELPLTTLTQRLPPRRVMAVGYFLVGVGFALNGCLETLPALAAAMMVFTLGEMCSMPVAAAYIAGLAPEHLRGRYLGAYTFTWSLALIFGPALGMLLLARCPLALWLAGGLLGALAAGVIGWDVSWKRAAGTT
jgi:MFS family permease